MNLGIFLVLTYVLWVFHAKISQESVDNSATVEYSYYDCIETGISMFDQTMTSLAFNPDDE